MSIDTLTHPTSITVEAPGIDSARRLDAVSLMKIGVLGQKPAHATESGIEAFAGVHAPMVHG